MIRRSALFVWLSFFLATAAGAATKTWTGSVSNLWSAGGNWSDALPPADGDSLVFGSGGSNRNTVNDLTGLDLVSISIGGESFPAYSASGNAITLSGGLTTVCCSIQQIVWSVPITLTASQTFLGPGSATMDLAGPIDLNGHTLTIYPYNTTLSGSLIGTGAVIVTNVSLNMTGTSSFAGTFTLSNGGMNVDGAISNATLSGNGNLSGSGTIPVTSLIASTVFPGSFPGAFCCSDSHTIALLTSRSFSMSGGTLGIDISATFDQVAVTGGVTLLNPTLQVSLPGILPVAGQTFVIIANDGADPVSGTFNGLPEGAVFTVSGVSFQITYAGGDGNDVMLTTQGGGPKSWTGAVNNLWSVGGNWNDGVAPVDGDSLLFGSGGANRNTVNDLTGLDLVSISIGGESFPAYSASGNAITLSGGLTTVCCSIQQIVWSVPITLTASQTFLGPGSATMDLAGPIDLNGHTLTIYPYNTTLSGSLIGTGAVIVTNISLNLTGTSSFAGTFTLSNGGVNVDGAISNATLSGNGNLSGSGTIPVTSLIASTVLPGSFPGAFCCADSHVIGVLTSGSFSMSGGTLGIDISGTTPGTSYDQIAVTGGVTLLSPTLQVTLTAFPLLPGQSFVIIANDGVDAVSGTFSGRPEGAVFTVAGTPFRITYAGGDGNDVVLTALATTTTTLSSSQNPTVSGQTFTLTAVVTSPSGTPTGSVRFLEGANVLATAPLDPAGVAGLVTAFPAGSYSIVAEYLGAATFAPSSSAPLTQVVNRAGSSAALSLSDLSIEHGDPLGVTVTVAAVPPGAGVPTGTVTVTADGDSVSGPLVAGQFNGSLNLDPGIHVVTATYSGDANFLATSTTATVEVLPLANVADAQAAGESVNTTVDVVVTLSGASNQTVRIDYATADGTAVAGTDYVAASGTVEFAPGVTSRTITLTILGDTTPEEVETFRLLLSNPQNAVIEDGEAVISINDTVAIPTAGTFGLILLGLILAAAGIVAVRA